MELLAKSNGTELVRHCRAVAKVSAYLAEHLGADANTVHLSGLAGLLHDIGKADHAFQTYMQSSVSPIAATTTKKRRTLLTPQTPADDDENDATPSLDIYHNEIGYAAMSVRAFDCLLQDLDEGDIAVLKQAVLWHHACQEKVVSVGAERIQPILDFAAHLLGTAAHITRAASGTFTPADMFAGSDPRNLVVRTCLVAADHVVSSMTPEQNYAIAEGNLLPGDIANIAELVRSLDLCDCHLPVPTTSRDAAQLECATHDGLRVTQVNAPTGFGKTRVGVLRTMHRKRRTLWVCPRNTVAEAVYANIVDELEQLRRSGVNPGLSVELYLTSKRQQSYGPVDPSHEYTADVIVTNIDMLLKPMVRNGLHERAYLGLFADVVMDEYHEFVMKDSAIFAACHNLLRARTQCAVASTMCLSATPSVLLSDLGSGSVDYLPAKGKHYPAVHSKPYKVRLHQAASVGDMPAGVPGSLAMLNSVRNAQNHYKRDTLGGVLVHSKYTDADRTQRMASVLSLFGKAGSGRESEQFVVSGPVLQAALNISFRSVHLSSSSAEADLQAARTNRFGELDSGEIHLYDVEDRGETAAIDSRWSRDLQRLWFAFLLHRYGDLEFTTTLDDIYVAYNDFYAEYARSIQTETAKWMKQGAVHLQALAPRRFTQHKARGIASSGPSKPSLRDPDGSCYILVPRDTREWLDVTDALSVSMQEFTRIVRAEPWIRRESDRKFVLSAAGLLKMWEAENGSNAARIASNPDTPFPTTLREYNSELGLTKTGDAAPDMDMVA